MPLKASLVDFSNMPKNVSKEEVDAKFNSSSPESFRDFIRDVESGKIKKFFWDMDISYEEFKERVLAGYYDEK